MKLYWRVKINGKWTWRPAKIYGEMPFKNQCVVWYLEDDDE
jgi:hypothetical protein